MFQKTVVFIFAIVFLIFYGVSNLSWAQPHLEWPVHGVEGVHWVTSFYVDLARKNNQLRDYRGGKKTYDGHTGVDIAVANFRWMADDFPVLAAAAGRVTARHDREFDRNISTNFNFSLCGMWNFVEVTHPDGSRAYYGHLKTYSVAVSVGQEVAPGDKLGVIGSSGCSQSPHLHFELRSPSGDIIDPFLEELWIDPPRYDAPPTLLGYNVTDRAILGINDVIDPPPNVPSISIGSTLGLGLTIAESGPGDVLHFTVSGGDGTLAYDIHKNFDHAWGFSWWYWNLPVKENPGPWRITVYLNDKLAAVHNLFVGPVPETTPVNETSIEGQISISEIMVTSNAGNLPQWIELYNSSMTDTVDLTGWNLQIENVDFEDMDGKKNAAFNFKSLTLLPKQTVLLVTTTKNRISDESHFPSQRVYNLYEHHQQILGLSPGQFAVLSSQGFSLKLTDKNGNLADWVGNLDGDNRTWKLPKLTTTDGERASMIRRYNNDTPIDGREARSWISAANTKLASRPVFSYYGNRHDIGTPNFRNGSPLPVTLAHFLSKRTDAGVAIQWTTESELNNAGFNILRSETEAGSFEVINPTLIPGAGTTSERNSYAFTDESAKPDVVYYYQIEEISLTGGRSTLATSRLREIISPIGKSFKTWGDLKKAHH